MNGFEQAYRLGRDGKKDWLDKLASTNGLTADQKALAYDIGVEMSNEPWKDLPPTRQQNHPQDIPTRSTRKLAQGFSAFAEGDPRNAMVDKLQPDGDKFDVAMHGAPNAVAFGSNNANMSARLLAEIIRRSDGYNGQPIRLLSSCTGYSLNGNLSFAQELANALGVTVHAPNDLIFFNSDGTFYTGKNRKETLLNIEPNKGGHRK